MTYFLDIRYVTKYDDSCQRVTNNLQPLYNELEMLIFDGIKKHRKGFIACMETHVYVTKHDYYVEINIRLSIDGVILKSDSSKERLSPINVRHIQLGNKSTSVIPEGRNKVR